MLNDSIIDTDNSLSKKIKDVKSKIVSEAVGITAKEIIATPAADKQVTSFTTSHLKDYVSKFFKSLLEAKDVASQSEIKAIHERLEKTGDAYKAFVSKVI